MTGRASQQVVLMFSPRIPACSIATGLTPRSFAPRNDPPTFPRTQQLHRAHYQIEWPCLLVPIELVLFTLSHCLVKLWPPSLLLNPVKRLPTPRHSVESTKQFASWLVFSFWMPSLASYQLLSCRLCSPSTPW